MPIRNAIWTVGTKPQPPVEARRPSERVLEDTIVAAAHPVRRMDADRASGAHLRALGELAGGQPVYRGLVPDLDLVPGGVVFPLAVLLGVAVGADPERGDLLGARGGTDMLRI